MYESVWTKGTKDAVFPLVGSNFGDYCTNFHFEKDEVRFNNLTSEAA